ncbi:phosphate ABC transporter ATP-binding protein PstB [Alteribacter aurantiacus]|uniref:phosphate ABC transporter ATP-binding protein PstB n=1 Tax=Alteribacter aurantiacus TaxID=254410 RepID=UPI0004015347|nr:phosphate ABC transporter ATP-binding protein PstB [Alteribacter aurantiacus]
MTAFQTAVKENKKKSPVVQENINKEESIFSAKGLNLWYGNDQALKDINLDIRKNGVTAIIGPSGCGKSTFLKTLNRMVELVPIVKTSGAIDYHGVNIFDPSVNLVELRSSVGMVFQKPNPFPKSIFDNVAFGPRVHGVKKKAELKEIVEKSLRGSGLWDEVKDRLGESAMGLSGGQQQRLCIARCLAVEPEVILMDEPTSALDPKSTLKVEELIQELKKDYSIVIVTHNMQQAARISDKTAFFLNGEVVEYDNTDTIFSNPQDKRTEDYITGRFG